MYVKHGIRWCRLICPEALTTAWVREAMSRAAESVASGWSHRKCMASREWTYRRCFCFWDLTAFYSIGSNSFTLRFFMWSLDHFGSAALWPLPRIFFLTFLEMHWLWQRIRILAFSLPNSWVKRLAWKFWMDMENGRRSKSLEWQVPWWFLPQIFWNAGQRVPLQAVVIVSVLHLNLRAYLWSTRWEFCRKVLHWKILIRKKISIAALWEWSTDLLVGIK